MGIFDKFKKKNAAAQASGITINVVEDGIEIDGKHLSVPLELEALQNVIGAPRSIHNDHYWDDYGIQFHTRKDKRKNMFVLCLLDNDKKAPLNKPTSTFMGELTVLGIPYQRAKEFVSLDDMTNMKEACIGEVIVSAFSPQKNTNGEFLFIQIYLNYKEEALELIPEKYNVPPCSEPTATFSSRNLKLAVVNELMYKQNLLTPKFDLSDFFWNNTGRKIHLEEEGYEPLPEALEWFDKLPIPLSMTTNVEALQTDGGDKINLNIWRFWDGEDGYFDVKSITENDLIQLPALSELSGSTVCLDDSSIELLKNHNIRTN